MTRVSLLGDDCLRISIAPNENKHSISDLLRKTQDWSEVVVGKQDITVQFSPYDLLPAAALAKLNANLKHCVADDFASGEIIEIPVSIRPEDAPDLKDVSDHIEVSGDEIWRRLTSLTFSIDMLGFTPGFAYMSGVPGDWVIDRLSSPRQFVPAGSIGLLTGQCGVYALAGPGGWPIIGRALVPLFDSASTGSPLLYSAGDRIRFVPDGHTND